MKSVHWAIVLSIAAIGTAVVTSCQWHSKVETSLGFGTDQEKGSVYWWLRELPKQGAEWHAASDGSQYVFTISKGERWVSEIAGDPAEAAKLAIAKWNQ